MLLADADRHRWDGAQRAEGLELVADLRAVLRDRPDRADLQGHNAGPLVLQAAIAAEHARAATFADTDWAAIVRLYDALLTIEPSPTIALGRCVAMSYLIDPAAGLADVDDVIAVGGLDRYPYAHAARAQMLERLGRAADAAEAWADAAACARTEAERSFFADPGLIRSRWPARRGRRAVAAVATRPPRPGRAAPRTGSAGPSAAAAAAARRPRRT